MSTPNIIKDQQQFNQTAQHFFNVLFGESLKQNCGEIEILGFQNGPRHKSYYNNVPDAVNTAYDLCQQGLDVYMGVNPRVGGAGKKENIHYLAAFHAEIDFGQDGHKKESDYDSYDEALEAINASDIRPTWVNHSGGGFHCYWVLKQPVNVSEIGVDQIENVNKALTVGLKGDVGTQNINRILRVPGTFNFKLPNNPREVTVVIDDGPKYDSDEFEGLMNFEEDHKQEQRMEVSESINASAEPST